MQTDVKLIHQHYVKALRRERLKVTLVQLFILIGFSHCGKWPLVKNG